MDYVTYDPDDDKVRIYFASRQPAEVIDPLKAAGFRWAPRLSCWFAVWSPAREDAAFAATNTDDYEREGSTREERAAGRAERFAGYSGNAAAESDALCERNKALTDAMNGQPVLIGHHSERRHRRQLASMDAAMRRACEADRRASYWQSRAHGSLAHAARMDRPDVRARRIKTLEADARKWERNLADSRATLAALSLDGKSMYAVASTVSSYRLSSRLFDALRIDDEALRAAAVAEIAESTRPELLACIEREERWIEHTAGRIAYEREQLESQGATHQLAPKPRKVQPPLLNLRAVPEHESQWGGVIPAGEAQECTSADYAKVGRDYKGTRTIGRGASAYRVRTACQHSLPGGGNGFRGSTVVFLTDKREDSAPAGEAVQP